MHCTKPEGLSLQVPVFKKESLYQFICQIREKPVEKNSLFDFEGKYQVHLSFFDRF
jgi:hypothetical protein